MMKNLKEQLYKMCIDYVQAKINEAKQGIDDAQYAAAEESKSSAGDKYETAREMMQQETDRYQLQLNEANKLMVALSKVNYNSEYTSADAGSVVTTNNGNFFVAISAGSFTVAGLAFFVVSPQSPIGIKLAGKKAGDAFELNGRAYQIQQVG
ncbi:3-oxoacyl-ACP synthase [Mucilaginibacter ginsenosidivorans]|nr:3-oxoacyl-ACP synthase [Mucilaginibacter ginsenosidivorans]